MTLTRPVTTLEAYHAFIDATENADRLFELIDGEIIEKMPSFEPSRIAMRIGRLIGNFIDNHDLGDVTGADGGYILPDGAVLIPDVGYISKARMPDKPEREVPVPPDFAVEVKSPTDAKRALRVKAERYMAAGTQMVWLVFPENREVEVYLNGQDVFSVGNDGELSGGDVLPGFTLPVSAIFPV
ncbi:MAG: Uma2 family endonuclease [bacterium]|nr:Uma2 family endonuclease [bacterium]